MDAEFPRRLTPAETGLLTYLLTKFFPNESHYLAQLSRSVVTGKCSCGCPTIDLWDEGAPAPPLSKARLLWQGQGLTAKNSTVIVTLLETAGRLSSFDVAYFGDEACDDLPLPESIEEIPPPPPAAQADGRLREG